MTYHLPSPHEFADRMQHHWTNLLGNVSSLALRDAWLQQGHHFGRHILAHDDPARAAEWTVLQPATGSGKSQGTAVYCAMLSGLKTTLDHPGVLIVTRLKSDADEMARTVTTVSGRHDYAVAYHSDATGPGVLESLRTFPVLVITHRAYELALDTLGQDGTIRKTWPFFHNWGIGTRRLVVIDEALDIVEESRGELAGLRMTLAAIPQDLRARHAYAVNAVEVVVSILETMAAKPIDEGAKLAEAILLRDQINVGTPPDILALRRDLRAVPFDRQLCRNDDELKRQQWVIHDDRLRALDMVFRSWVYYAKIPMHGHTLNTARLLVPDEVKGAVVLDATAKASVIYQLFDRANVVTPPAGVRNYANVTLHVSRGHKVGKVAMRNDGDALVAAVLDDLNARLAGRPVLVVSHKETEAKVLAKQTTFSKSTAHWGAVTGSNAWRDCDAAVILGLPYRPDTWTANTYMALQGVQSTDWLRSDDRPFGPFPDVRQALKLGQVVSDITQAINRIRCRKVIDDRGNCPRADVFLLLPTGPQGDEIQYGIEDMMPGIRVQPWTLTTQVPKAKKRGKRAKAGGETEMVAAAVAYLKASLPGKIGRQRLLSALRMKPRHWDALAEAAKSPASPISAELTAANITYQVERIGKTSRATFVKGA